MKIQLDHNSQTYSLDLAQSGKITNITVDGQTHTVEILRTGEGWLDLCFSAFPSASSAANIRFSALSAAPSPSSAASSAAASASNIRFSVAVSVAVSVAGPKRWVTVNGQTFMLTQLTGPAKRGGHAQHAAGALTAPMPGQIRTVQVTQGEAVAKGQTLVVVEAMKMELKVAAPFDGVVKMVKVQPGQTVEKDELLVEMESKE